jgi:VCBS repeat-containing protein
VTLTVAAKGVLLNDGTQAVSAALVSNPSHGTVTLNANGSFTYVPVASFYGTDTYTYVARNSAGVAGPIATVTIVVKKNVAPNANNDAYSTEKNQVLTVTGTGVLANDTDGNGNTLTAVVVTAPAHGTLTLNANGTFVYTPALNYTGTDSYTYKALDPLGLSDNATVTISITQHYNGDGCDHDRGINGHYHGDGCDHDHLR